MPKTCFSAAAWRGIGLATLALAASCTYSHGPDPSPAPTPTGTGTSPTANPCNDPTPPTYAAVVSPILDARCRGCHGAAFQTRGGSVDLSTYQALTRLPANVLLGSIRQEAGFSAMPKGGAKLSDCDIARIQGWVEAGRLNN